MQYNIVENYPAIENIFPEFEKILGDDYLKYKNHVYRVFNFCLYLTNYNELFKDKFAIALCFHDIGLWSDNTWDYLPPSVIMAKEYLLKSGKEEWIDEISVMIEMHHKLTSYNKQYYETTEILRKADLADLSFGLSNPNIDKIFLYALRRKFPNDGFHLKLTKSFFDNLLKKPFKPAPMFKL